MNEYTRRRGWGIGLAVLLLLAVTAGIAYNVGLSQGVAQTVITQAPSGQVPVVPPYAYGWYRPWGFGFGFPFFLLFIFLWFGLLRGLFWGGGRWRHRYYMDAHGVPLTFDEWHRRAHERMKEAPSADDSGRRG